MYRSSTDSADEALSISGVGYQLGYRTTSEIPQLGHPASDASSGSIAAVSGATRLY